MKTSRRTISIIGTIVAVAPLIIAYYEYRLQRQQTEFEHFIQSFSIIEQLDRQYLSGKDLAIQYSAAYDKYWDYPSALTLYILNDVKPKYEHMKANYDWAEESLARTQNRDPRPFPEPIFPPGACGAPFLTDLPLDSPEPSYEDIGTIILHVGEPQSVFQLEMRIVLQEVSDKGATLFLATRTDGKGSGSMPVGSSGVLFNLRVKILAINLIDNTATILLQRPRT